MISVVVSLYNKEKSILNTINSVLNQRYSDFELVVIDDGSTDTGVKIVNQIIDPRIKLYTQQNRGVSNARNRGVCEAKYNYVALLDADDIWDPFFLEEMIRLIEDYPEASLFGCTWAFIHADGRKAVADYMIPEGFRGYVDNYFETGIQNALFNSSSVLFEKNAFFELGMFDETLTIGEDVDLWFRFALKKTLAFINKCMSFYLLGTENRASNKEKIPTECLIWNLDRFKNDEDTNPNFKTFLDSWRFAHIDKFFKGDKSEIQEITPLLKRMDLSKYPVFWTIIQDLPKPLQLVLYNIRLNYQKILEQIRP